MKKFFVSAFAVLNLLFASAQEERMSISFTPAGNNIETTTNVENKAVDSQVAVSNQTQPNQSVSTDQPAVSQQTAVTQQPTQQTTANQSVATQSAATQPVSTQTAEKSNTAPSTESSSSSSDDYDSEFFGSNNESSPSGEVKNVFGIRFGYSASKISSLGVYSNSVSGFTFGAIDQIWFGETNVCAEVGAFFTQKGYALKGFEPSETRINYIEIPAVLCHRIGRETLSISAMAGGFVSLGINGKLKTLISDHPAAIDLFKSEHEFDLFEEGAISRFDAGVRFGLSFVIRKVILGCRYDLGLYGVDKKDIIYEDNELMLGYKHLKTRSFQILLGFNFK